VTSWPEPVSLALLANILHPMCAWAECGPTTLVESWSGLVLGIRKCDGEVFV
jgi:hypothetical protein